MIGWLELLFFLFSVEVMDACFCDSWELSLMCGVIAFDQLFQFLCWCLWLLQFQFIYCNVFYVAWYHLCMCVDVWLFKRLKLYVLFLTPIASHTSFHPWTPHAAISIAFLSPVAPFFLAFWILCRRLNLFPGGLSLVNSRLSGCLLLRRPCILSVSLLLIFTAFVATGSFW